MYTLVHMYSLVNLISFRKNCTRYAFIQTNTYEQKKWIKNNNRCQAIADMVLQSKPKKNILILHIGEKCIICVDFLLALVLCNK